MRGQQNVQQDSGHGAQEHQGELNRQRRYYRKRQAYARCPWSDAKTWRLIRSGDLPHPIANLGGKLPIFDADEWDASLDALIAKAATTTSSRPDNVAEARRVQKELRAERARNAAT